MEKLAWLVLVIPVAAFVVEKLVGPDAHLLSGVRRLRDWLRERAETAENLDRRWWRADELVRKGEQLLADPQHAGRILNSARLMTFLTESYPDHPPMWLDGVRMPVWAVPVPADQQASVDSILGGLAPGRAPGIDDYSEEFCPGGAPTFWRKHEERKALAPEESHRLTSDPTYSMERVLLRDDGSLTLECRMGRYFTHLATARTLASELAAAVAANRGRISMSDLPMRGWLHKQVPNPVLHGDHRNAAIGLSTLVLMRQEAGGFHAIVPTRSPATATDARVMHVCPAGMFQPFMESPNVVQRDFSLARNFAREFVEELYAVESAHASSDDLSEDFVLEDCAPYQRLQQHLSSTPGSSLRLTGFCVNLLTLQPEACLLLVIDDPGWFARERAHPQSPLKFNWEIAGRRDNVRGFILEVDEDLKIRDGGTLRASDLVPQAAAALRLGLDALAAERDLAR